MNFKTTTYILLIILLAGCALGVKTTITKSSAPLDYKQEVRVLEVSKPAPANAEELGTIDIYKKTAAQCDYAYVIQAAKMEARKAGGNVVLITEHLYPDGEMGCHRIKAKILKVDNFDDPAFIEPVDSTLLNADYSLLHIYRFSGYGSLIGYDIHLGDSVICRAKNCSRHTIKIRKDGMNSIWAKTEAKSEIPINIQFGKEYYIRCSLTTGIMVGHPKIEMIENWIGREEYKSFSKN